jgi:hypothetical protein
MDTLKVGMKFTQEWEVTEARTTQRGELQDLLHAVHDGARGERRERAHPAASSSRDQGQVGMFVTVRHMASTPLGKKVRAEAELIGIDRRGSRSR